MKKPVLFSSVLIILLLASPAHAYIGPGLGTGAIAAVLGVLASIFLAFLSILWYPIKRLLRRGCKAINPEKPAVSKDHMPNELGSDSHA